MVDEKRIITIPNILSMFRVVLIPFIVWSFFAGNKILSAGLTVLSGVTDIIDGLIARKFNMVSELGKALDPIADKLTQFALIISLCVASVSMFFLLCIFVVKEVAMGIEGLIVIKKTGTTYSAKWYGKITTALLYVTMIAHIVFSDISLKISNVMIDVCELFVIISLILYTIRNVIEIKKIDNQSKENNVST